MGPFNELTNELRGEAHQTTRLHVKDMHRIEVVMCALCANYLNCDDWNIKVNEGSITYRRINAEHQVLKIFIDYENELIGKIGLSIPEKDPIAIGLELGFLDPIVRTQIRDYLRKSNRSGIDYYVDPVKYAYWQKTYLLPITDHFYDVLFLRKGNCEYDEDQEILYNVRSILEQGIRKFDQNPNSNTILE